MCKTNIAAYGRRTLPHPKRQERVQLHHMPIPLRLFSRIGWIFTPRAAKGVFFFLDSGWLYEA
jgi:hypothetical protein